MQSVISKFALKGNAGLISGDKSIIYVHDRALRAALKESLDILGFASKDVLLEELANLGVLADSTTISVTRKCMHSLDEIQSTLIKVVGEESSNLIMSRLKLTLEKKGWNFKDVEQSELSKSDILRIITTTISEVLGLVSGQHLIRQLESYVTALIGTEMIDHEYFVIEKPWIFEEAMRELLGSGSYLILKTISSYLISELCPEEISSLEYSKPGDYAKLIDYLKDKIS